MSELSWQERIYEDIELHVRVKASQAVVDYEVRKLIMHDDGVGPALKFETFESGSNEMTTDVEKADILIKGYIRFDGCSNNNFGEGGYIHACSREDMTRLGTLYDRLFDWAIKLIGCEESLGKTVK